MLEGELGQIDDPTAGAPMPAGRGSSATDAAWMAPALHVAGKMFIRDAWTDLASDAFGRLVRRQQPNGAFLLATASDNPETHWYHELVLLHAAASYAVQAEDRTVATAVARARGCITSTRRQPDHATRQPWGLFAFIWNEPRADPGRSTPARGVRCEPRQATTDGVSLMLLADAILPARCSERLCF